VVHGAEHAVEALNVISALKTPAAGEIMKAAGLRQSI
jgi:hypothetical protein